MQSNESPMVLCVHLINSKRCWKNQCTYHVKMWRSFVLYFSWKFTFFDNLIPTQSNCHNIFIQPSNLTYIGLLGIDFRNNIHTKCPMFFFWHSRDMLQNPITNLTTLGKKTTTKPIYTFNNYISPTKRLMKLKFCVKINPFYFQQLYLSNKKFNEVEILYDDALSTNLTLFQFLNKSIFGLKISWI